MASDTPWVLMVPTGEHQTGLPGRRGLGYTIDDATALYAALLRRVSLGIAFLAHGLFKIRVFTSAGTARSCAMFGLPLALDYAVITAEVVEELLLVHESIGAGLRFP